MLGAGAAPPAGCGRAVVDGFAGSTSVALLLVGVLDPAREAARLQDKQARRLCPNQCPMRRSWLLT